MIVMKKPVLAATASLFVLSACTGGFENRAQEGAAIGAATGAVWGLLTGNNAKQQRSKAVTGAIIGGIAGGLIGTALDAQAAELQQSIGDDRVQIINTGSELVVRMPDDILFATDSTEVRPDLRQDLAALAAHLQRYPDSTVQVIGHTDNTGPAAYNRNLSLGRANAVAAILIANGVPSWRIATIGRGEDDPIATNLTPEGRAQNRRVEIVIIPNG